MGYSRNQLAHSDTHTCSVSLLRSPTRIRMSTSTHMCVSYQATGYLLCNKIGSPEHAAKSHILLPEDSSESPSLTRWTVITAVAVEMRNITYERTRPLQRHKKRKRKGPISPVMYHLSVGTFSSIPISRRIYGR